MKTKILSLLSFLLFVNTFAQIDFQEHLISNLADYPNSLYAADLDSDGDLDVLSASRDDNIIAWYENINGLGDFAPQKIISDTNDLSLFVSACDLDGDNDMDVLASDRYEISWYENINGNGVFSSKKVIRTTLLQLRNQLEVVDIDSDGDLDILYFEHWGDKVKWLENTDGQGNFGLDHLIDDCYDTGHRVKAGDFDGDSDLDIVILETYNYWGSRFSIELYENIDGQGSFNKLYFAGSTYINQFGSDLILVDLDNDDDLDIVCASRGVDNYDIPGGKIFWFENTNGSFNFEDVQLVVTDADNKFWDIFTADIDLDGDIDILSSTISYDNGIVTWYENIDSEGTFGAPQVIANDLTYPTISAADIDGDDDIDVMSSSALNNADKIIWYENLSPLGVEENNLTSFSIYPSPTSNVVTIQSKLNIIQIRVNNNLGQIVLSNSNKNSIDLSSLNQGLYFINITDENGNLGFKKILKE